MTFGGNTTPRRAGFGRDGYKRYVPESEREPKEETYDECGYCYPNSYCGPGGYCPMCPEEEI